MDVTRALGPSIVLAAAVCALAPARADRRPLAPTGAPPARGLALPLRGADPLAAARDALKLLPELPAQGATHVAVFVDLWQRDATSAAPARHPLLSPPDKGLLELLQKARALELEVALVPCLQLERPGDDRPATIRPPDWAAWFAGYRRELLHWARLAEDGGASILAVGSGLASSEDQVALWRELIAEVRRGFSGTLTYAASWDRHRSFQAWADLDAIGVRAYDPLAGKPGAGVSDLVATCGAARDRLLAWRREQGLRQPLLLLEVGYPALEGAATRPWDDAPRGRGLDLEEQRRCYEAFTSAWSNVADLAGCFFYAWSEGGTRDLGFSPRGKPAQQVVQRWFGAPPPETKKPPPPASASASPAPDGEIPVREQR